MARGSVDRARNAASRLNCPELKGRFGASTSTCSLRATCRVAAGESCLKRERIIEETDRGAVALPRNAAGAMKVICINPLFP